MSFAYTNSHLTTKPYNLDIKCQSNSKSMTNTVLLGPSAGVVRIFLFTVGGFFNKREYFGAEWLSLSYILKFPLYSLIFPDVLYSVHVALNVLFTLIISVSNRSSRIVMCYAISIHSSLIHIHLYTLNTNYLLQNFETKIMQGMDILSS